MAGALSNSDSCALDAAKAPLGFDRQARVNAIADAAIESPGVVHAHIDSRNEILDLILERFKGYGREDFEVEVSA